MKRFISVFWELVRPFRRNFLNFFVLIAIYEFVQILDSYTLSLFIEIHTNPAFSGWVEQFPLSAYLTPRNVSIVILVIILCYDEVFIRFDRLIDWKVIYSLLYPVYRYLKESALAKFMEMDLTWHRSKKSGALIGKVQQGTDKMSEFIMNLGWELMPTLIQFVLSLIPILLVIPQAVIVLTAAFVIFMIISLRQYTTQRPYRTRRHKGYESEHAHAHESVVHAEAVQHHRKVPSREAAYFTILQEEIQEQAEINDRLGLYVYGSWRMRIVEWSRRIMMVMLLLQLTSGAISIATLIFIWTLSERLIHSFWRIARLMDIAAENLQAAERVLDLLNTESAIKDPDHPVHLPKGPYEICFDDVSFRYNGSKDGIQQLNLLISAGETIGIVGPSGAGKTTLRRLLTRTVDVTSGMVTLNGVDVRNLKLHDLRSCLTYVPQGEEAAIFADTFLYNISFGAPDDWSPWKKFIRSVRAAKKAGINDFIKSTEHGYHTVLGERGLQLSGGQRQRVALARALVSEAPILILDEATSAVDSLTEAEIQKQLMSVFGDKNKTVLVIAHRLSTIKMADRILVFDDGQLAEQGSHQQLLDQNGLYARMYREQAEAH